MALTSIGKSRSEGGNGLIVRNKSPWETFKKVYKCDLAGTVEVVARRSGPRVVHILRQFPATSLYKILNIIRLLRYKNVSSALEYFCFENILYAIGDFYPLTLGYIVVYKAFLTEP